MPRSNKSPGKTTRDQPASTFLSSTAPEWHAKYLEDIASGVIKYPRIDSQYGPLVPYTEAARELCYEIWAFQTGRNAAQTERILWYILDERPDMVVELELNHEHEIKVSKIRDWVDRLEWDQRANMELASIMPQIRRTAYRELGLAVLPAIQTLREVTNDRTRTNAGINAVRMKAALGLMDRAGYGPRFDVDAPRTQIVDLSKVDVRSMTVDQLLALDAQLIDGTTTE